MILYQNVLSSVLLNAFPFLCVMAIWCLKFFEHLLPTKQQEMLERCVKMAVAMAEQSYDDYGPLEKKQIALRASIDLFHAFHLPVPQPAALNTAIEASVFAVRQAQAQIKMASNTSSVGDTMCLPVVASAPASLVAAPQSQFVTPLTSTTPTTPTISLTAPTTGTDQQATDQKQAL